MKTIYKIILSLIAMCSITLLQAQSLERSVIASAGASQSASGVKLNSTVGEAITQTKTSGSVILNQGFQQGDILPVGIEENQIKIDYSFYPNPTSDFINIELTSEKSGEANLQILSLDGKVIQTETFQLVQSQTVYKRFDLSNQTNGMYLISIQSKDGNGIVIDKIQKLN